VDAVDQQREAGEVQHVCEELEDVHAGLYI